MPTLLTATGTSYNKSTLAALFANQTISTGSWLTIVFSLALAFATGLFIYWIYRSNYRGVMYNNNFGLTLVLMTLITTPVVMCIRESIQLSMGMVGALSIVRFRTAIKEPMDIAFLFWSIAAGIVLAAGMIPLAVFGSVVIGVVLLFFVNRKAVSNPFIAVVSCADAEAEKRAVQFLGEHVEKASVKSKTAQSGNIEFTCEVRLKGDDTAFITALSEMEGVNSAVLVSYNGDYMD